MISEKKTKRELYFLIAEMPGRHNACGNEGRVEGTQTWARELSLTTSGFVWRCQVLMPIRLLMTNGHLDDIPSTMLLAGAVLFSRLSSARF